MATFYDTHAHLDYPDFAKDFDEMQQRAVTSGIIKAISIGTDLESSGRAIKLAERYPAIYAVVGWHPSHALDAPQDIRAALREMAKHPKVVALGETGFDYHHLPSRDKKGGEADDVAYKARQRELFNQHLEVAADTGLNCVIHQRDSLEDTLLALSPYAERVRGVFHCFSSTEQNLRRILEMGCLVSYTGIVTFKNGQNVRDCVAATPMGKFMLETDCPYLAPVPYRGKRCEPAYVKEIAELIAQVKGCSLDQLSEATCQAAHAFFPKLAA